MRRAAAGWLVLALGAAGCGGDGDAERLSAAEYREQANAICVRYDRRAERLGAPQGQTREELLEYVDDILPLGREQLRELRALRPPEQLAAEHGRLLEAGGGVVRAVERLREATAAEDAAAAQEALAAGQAANERANELSRRLGLDDCVDMG